MFIGRERELESLNNLYRKKGFAMSVIYGRRRIGKSTLIARFIEDKESIFYTATKVGGERNIELFSKQAVSVLDPAFEGASFQTIENVFDFITGKLPRKKLVLVIDELPYWAESDESLLSVLQKYIDTQWADKNIMLILCGSSLSFMESKVLSEKSPIFGRRDSQIKLEAFGYKETARFVPDYSYEEKAICYGITGGVAKYLSLLKPENDLDTNIKELFFKTDGYLYDETRNLLTQEFNDIAVINNIIEQIAYGENTVNSIASKVHEKDTTVLYSLEKLISVGLVEKRTCITEEKNKKKTQYILKDHMFKFWYKFVPKGISLIELGQGEVYYEKAVKPNLHDFMGSVFEEMCKAFTLERSLKGDYGVLLTGAGKWWGVERLKDEEGKRYSEAADIDIVAISAIDKAAVVGECKFKNEKTDRDIYTALKRRSLIIAGKYEIKKLLLFSLSGFSKWFSKEKPNDLIMYSLKDLYKK